MFVLVNLRQMHYAIRDHHRFLLRRDMVHAGEEWCPDDGPCSRCRGPVAALRERASTYRLCVRSLPTPLRWPAHAFGFAQLACMRAQDRWTLQRQTSRRTLPAQRPARLGTLELPDVQRFIEMGKAMPAHRDPLQAEGCANQRNGA